MDTLENVSRWNIPDQRVCQVRPYKGTYSLILCIIQYPYTERYTVNDQDIRNELDPVISDLETQGVSFSDTDKTGLGDVLEATLTKFGITQERFKEWTGLKECNCTARKKWLNSLINWKKS